MTTKTTAAPTFPAFIDDERTLDDVLTTPSAELIEAARHISGDIVLLGVGGKMGPTLAVLLRRALDAADNNATVTGVSRFTRGSLRQDLEDAHIRTISADLLDPDQLARVRTAPNVIYLVGMKFGSTGQSELTWAMNAYLPGMVAQHFAGSRIVALSTGNVYPLVPVNGGGQP